MDRIKNWEGYWYLPDKPEDKVGGILTYDPNKGSILNCFSDFGSRTATCREIDPPVLFGDTQEGLVTAFGSFRKTFLTDTPTFVVNYIIVGHQLKNPLTMNFKSVDAEISGLFQWLQSRAIYYRPSKTRISFSTVLPKPKTFQLSADIHGLLLFFYQKHNVSNESISINLSAKLVLQFQKHYSFEGAMKELNRIRQLLVILSGQLKYVNKVMLTTIEDKECEVFMRINPERGDSLKKLALFEYRDLIHRFKSLWPKWYELSLKIEPSIYLLTKQLYNSAFSENSFLNILQAIDGFHNAVIGGTKLPPKTFDNLKTRIIAKVPNNAPKEFKDMILGLTNRKSHKKQLEEFQAKYAGENLAAKIKEQQNFTRTVVQLRNHYTHFPSTVVPMDNKMFYLTSILRKLLIAGILIELGLDKEEVDRRLMRMNS